MGKESPLFTALRHKIAIRDTFGYASYEGYDEAVRLKGRDSMLKNVLSVEIREDGCFLEYCKRNVSRLRFSERMLGEIKESEFGKLLNESDELVLEGRDCEVITKIYNWMIGEE